MADRIKGITVEIGGDTTKLGKALSDTNKQLKTTQNDLKKVEQLLKIDPTNTELLAQKQRLLAESISDTKDKLEVLKQAASTANQQLANQAGWEQQYTPLKAQLQETASKMSELKSRDAEMKAQLERGEVTTEAYEQLQAELKETRKQHKDLLTAKKELDASFSEGHMDQSQYDALQRSLIQTEKELEGLEKELGGVGKQAEDSNQSLSKLSDGLMKVSDKAGKVSSATAPITKGVMMLGGAAVATVPATEELRTALSRLDTNAKQTGVGVGSARQAFSDLYVVSGELDSSVEAVSNLLQSGFTESNLQIAVEGLSNAAIAFPDTIKIESLADSLQETLATGNATGQFAEMLDRMGIGAENFSNGMSMCTTEAEKQSMALSALNIGPLSGYYETWKETNPEMVQARESSLQLQQSMADLAESIQPLLTKVAEIATAFLDWFNGLNSSGQGVVVAMAGIAASISPVANAVSSMSKVIPAATDLFGKLSYKAIAVSTAIGAIVLLAAKVVDAWEDMSGVEKVASAFGLLVAAAGAAAIAVGACQSALTMGIAAAAIVAGILAVAIALKSATAKAQEANDSFNKKPGRKYATGTDYHPGGEALVGENGPELVRMPRGSRVYSTSDTKEMMSNSGAQSVDITLRVVAGDSLARDLSFQVDRATQLRGIKVVSGV